MHLVLFLISELHISTTVPKAGRLQKYSSCSELSNKDVSREWGFTSFTDIFNCMDVLITPPSLTDAVEDVNLNPF